MKRLQWKWDIDDDGGEAYSLKIGDIFLEIYEFGHGDNTLYFNSDIVSDFPSVPAAKRYARKWLIELRDELNKL